MNLSARPHEANLDKWIWFPNKQKVAAVCTKRNKYWYRLTAVIYLHTIMKYSNNKNLQRWCNPLKIVMNWDVLTLDY